MGAAIGGLVVAVGFLTRVPVPARVAGSGDLARAVPWFPVVGAGVGVAVGATVEVLAGVLPALVAATAAVAVGVVITGAFHEDGLADSFDGLGGGRDPAHALEIMRDSRLGTFGVAALVLALALRVGLVAEVVELGPIQALAAVGALSRAAAVGVMLVAPAAGGEGLGAGYLAAIRPVHAVVGVAAGIGLGGLAVGVDVLAPAVAAAVAAGLMAVWAVRKVGGVTGDVLGACQQVADLAVLGVLVGLAS